MDLRQKINTKVEAELVGVDDVMPQILRKESESIRTTKVPCQWKKPEEHHVENAPATLVFNIFCPRSHGSEVSSVEYCPTGELTAEKFTQAVAVGSVPKVPDPNYECRSID